MQQKFHSRRLYATSEVFAKFESFPISWLNRAAAFCHVHSGSRPLAVMVHKANYTVRIPHSMCLPNRFFVQGRGKLKISHKIIVNTARMSIISIFPGIISRDNVPKAIISSCEVYGKFVTQQAFQFFLVSPKQRNRCRKGIRARNGTEISPPLLICFDAIESNYIQYTLFAIVPWPIMSFSVDSVFVRIKLDLIFVGAYFES